MQIKKDLLPEEERRGIPAEYSFGSAFTDHMFSQHYNADKGWHDAHLHPLRDISLHPAAAVLHYGQEIFEGLKAYRRPDGGINLFRPDQNAARFNRSAERMVMPTVAPADHLEAIKQLVLTDAHWVPDAPGSSLYLRPALVADTPKLGLGAAATYLHFIIASPVGPYYAEGFNPISVLVEENYRRSVRGGVGEAKTGGNYAASLFTSERAASEGFTQVLWLDAIHGRYIEEVGAMNICFVYDDGTIATPALSGSILRGVTRDSVLQLSEKLGYKTLETSLDIEDVTADIDSGKITEVFGCGTAAVISPVGKLAFRDKHYEVNGGEVGPVAQKLFDTLTGIQYGTVEDPFDWIVSVC